MSLDNQKHIQTIRTPFNSIGQVTTELLIAAAKNDRAQYRTQSDANCLRLGQFVVKRRVHDYVVCSHCYPKNLLIPAEAENWIYLGVAPGHITYGNLILQMTIGHMG